MSQARLLISSSSAHRRDQAAAWLDQLERSANVDQRVSVLVDQLSAAEDLLHPQLLAGQRRAFFAVERYTLDLLALELSRPQMVARELVVATPAALQAVVGSVLDTLRPTLSHYADVLVTPGFARKVYQTCDELRLHGVAAEKLSPLGAAGQELAAILAKYERLICQQRLLDRCALLQLATSSVSDRLQLGVNKRPAALICFDLSIETPVEQSLIGALARTSQSVFAVVADGDERTRAAFLRALPDVELDSDQPNAPNGAGQESDAGPAEGAVFRLQRRLLQTDDPLEPLGDREEDDASLSPIASTAGTEQQQVVIFSAPTAQAECVEIVRRALGLIRGGLRADQIGVLLRQASPYVELLEEAANRLGLPIYPAEGAFRPDPAGRAFLLLLECALERLPATRFAEYLSLGQAPGAPPVEWVDALQRDHDPELAEQVEQTAERQKQLQHVAPARWERLIGDAAVVGGLDRWRRRLAGLSRELQLRLTRLEEADEAFVAAIERDLDHLSHLERFALPLLSRLAQLPRHASWGEWIALLIPLAEKALGRPQRVVELLEQLRPLAGVSGVPLRRVIDALSRRLTDLKLPPPAHRYGRLYVGLAEEARGRCFEAVFIAGLAERSFPAKVLQDPVLLDRAREQLFERGQALPLPRAAERRRKERLFLRLAAGAARRYVGASYPRMDLSRAQPRVPSFYLLEIARSVQGRLPDFEQLIAQAAAATEAHLERPFPLRPEDAIDDHEYDLALLAESATSADKDRQDGYAAHLHTHPFLVPALRAHWQRGSRSLTAFDGFMTSRKESKELLALDSLRQRAYAVTTLENYARCPYRFFLRGVLKLKPPVGLQSAVAEGIDPRTRGTIFHDAIYEVCQTLLRHGLLPLSEQRLDRALALFRRCGDALEKHFKDELAPPIEAAWQHEFGLILAEVEGFLQREAAAQKKTPSEPLGFELAFGLSSEKQPILQPSDQNDESDESDESDEGPQQRAASLLSQRFVRPASVAGYLLRGAVDLVEKLADGTLRVTDYKTGRGPTTAQIEPFEGGKGLQRVLYGLALEALGLGKASVGRLYFATERGGYREFPLLIDTALRQHAEHILSLVDGAICAGELPAIPEQDQCRFCDYLRVCGRGAQARAERIVKKGDVRLGPLHALRGEL
jgi:ATP-dependent helicase/nuclease subunit B